MIAHELKLIGPFTFVIEHSGRSNPVFIIQKYYSGLGLVKNLRYTGDKVGEFDGYAVAIFRIKYA